MTDYGTIKIPEPAYDYHNERRKENGQTWEQYINGQEPDAPGDVDTESLVSDLKAQLPAAVADEVENRLR